MTSLIPHSTGRRFRYTHDDHGVSLNYSKSPQKCGQDLSNLVHARFSTLPLLFGYSSVTLQLRSYRAGHDSAACRCASATPEVFPRRFCYDPSTIMKFRLSLVYADGDTVATLPRPRWSYAFFVIWILFFIKSAF